MGWTDKNLAELQQMGLRLIPAMDKETVAELYRLARLGLAAEKCTRDNLQNIYEDALDPDAWHANKSRLSGFHVLMDHPAWRLRG